VRISRNDNERAHLNTDTASILEGVYLRLKLPHSG